MASPQTRPTLSPVCSLSCILFLPSFASPCPPSTCASAPTQCSAALLHPRSALFRRVDSPRRSIRRRPPFLTSTDGSLSLADSHTTCIVTLVPPQDAPSLAHAVLPRVGLRALLARLASLAHLCTPDQADQATVALLLDVHGVVATVCFACDADLEPVRASLAAWTRRRPSAEAHDQLPSSRSYFSRL